MIVDYRLRSEEEDIDVVVILIAYSWLSANDLPGIAVVPTRRFLHVHIQLSRPHGWLKVNAIRCSCSPISRGAVSSS